MLKAHFSTKALEMIKWMLIGFLSPWMCFKIHLAKKHGSNWIVPADITPQLGCTLMVPEGIAAFQTKSRRALMNKRCECYSVNTVFSCFTLKICSYFIRVPAEYFLSHIWHNPSLRRKLFIPTIMNSFKHKYSSFLLNVCLVCTNVWYWKLCFYIVS